MILEILLKYLQDKQINYATKVLFYGFNENNNVVIKNMNLTEKSSEFDLFINNELYGHFNIPLFGKHMVMDATAAIIIAKELGLEKDTIEKLLQTFHNAKRRFEEQRVGDSIIIDDYAHHPTEIKVTLEAVKQKYPNKRLVVVFAPNTYSRTKDFKNEFIAAFKVADKAYLTEIDCNREKQEDYPGITSHIITDNLKDSEIISVDTMDKLKNETSSVVCFMGCAYVDGLISAYKKVIENNK